MDAHIITAENVPAEALKIMSHYKCKVRLYLIQENQILNTLLCHQIKTLTFYVAAFATILPFAY